MTNNKQVTSTNKFGCPRLTLKGGGGGGGGGGAKVKSDDKRRFPAHDLDSYPQPLGSIMSEL